MVVATLVDVIAGLLLTPDQFDLHAGVVLKIEDVEAQVACLDGHGQVHDGGGGAVEDAELDGAAVDVAELAHLVRQVVGVHQPDGSRVGQNAVQPTHALKGDTNFGNDFSQHAEYAKKLIPLLTSFPWTFMPN